MDRLVRLVRFFVDSFPLVQCIATMQGPNLREPEGGLAPRPPLPPSKKKLKLSFTFSVFLTLLLINYQKNLSQKKITVKQYNGYFEKAVAWI